MEFVATGSQQNIEIKSIFIDKEVQLTAVSGSIRFAEFRMDTDGSCTVRTATTEHAITDATTKDSSNRVTFECADGASFRNMEALEIYTSLDVLKAILIFESFDATTDICTCRLDTSGYWSGTEIVATDKVVLRPDSQLSQGQFIELKSGIYQKLSVLGNSGVRFDLSVIKKKV